MSAERWETTQFETVLTPTGNSGNFLKTAWDHRYILVTLVKREWALRYATSKLNAVWNILRPLLQVSVYLFVFLTVFRKENDDIPYALIILTGYLGWIPFIEGLGNSGKAMYSDVAFLKRASFPKWIFPVYRSFLMLPELLLFLTLSIIFSASFGYLNTNWESYLLLPFIFFWQWLMVIAFSLITNVWLIVNNDIHQLFFSIIGFLIWITPVFYMPEMMPEVLRDFLQLNPLAGILHLLRNVLLGMPLQWVQWVPGLGITMVLLIVGVSYFRKYQELFIERL